MDTKNHPETESRWRTYGNYRLILFSWMLNEISIVFSTTEMSHNGFYVHAALQIASAIFIGIPLLYSEICIAQYTNCNIMTMWNYFPLFRCIGHSMIFLVILKTILVMILTTWHLEYTFYAALDPPPWFSCDDYNNTKCMVKRIDVSVFQHCLETQILFDDDCGMKTASYCFFEREIGDKNTLISNNCFYYWKPIVASTTIAFALFILTIKKEKIIQIIVKLLVVYVSAVILVLLFIALSTSGVWHTTKISLIWRNYNFDTCYKSLTNGFLGVGTGYGVIGFLSRDVNFRSPANMTSIGTALFSTFASIMLALIAFSGIKTMSYFHGEEENVVEMGESSFFLEYASISEIMSYFDSMPIWGFAWFSTGFWYLFVNLWILYLFLRDLLLENIYFVRKHDNLSCALLALFITISSCPFFCSDLTGSITDATEILQTFNSLLFSLSIYWFYGYNNHSVDIIFMVGIKASYFWKICWIFNPLLLASIFYWKCRTLMVYEYADSRLIESLSIRYDYLVFLIMISIYCVIVLISLAFEILFYYRSGDILSILSPSKNWGPKDPVLFRSRKMFIPEIMTREFLYRQVRIHGICIKKNTRCESNNECKKVTRQSSNRMMEWSALTSN